jgi:hypothetical protein
MAFLHYNASLHFPKSGEFVFDDRADIVSDDITNRSWDGCNPDLLPLAIARRLLGGTLIIYLLL